MTGAYDDAAHDDLVATELLLELVNLSSRTGTIVSSHNKLQIRFNGAEAWLNQVGLDIVKEICGVVLEALRDGELLKMFECLRRFLFASVG